ncbi:cation channel sperm-associated protein 1 isoform X3 [Chelonoidis abingdonii]|uniref:cation channel sperm-associated protein 1 isoform X3 n=1 Tax=Chelonoidis abingdonii TaxID=106734 RepID=UPI0013F236BA|nr:cation channel sperm-associated protein 1 isoform X4 [Chelonoidis abingdonii]
MDYLTVPVVSGTQMEKPPYKEETPPVSQAFLQVTSASPHPPKILKGKQGPWQRWKWRGTMVLLRLAWERTLPQLLTLRAIIQKLTQLLAFELFILTVIGIHTTVLVVQTFAVVRVRGEWFFSAMDAVFLCIYVLEALLKLIALDLNYFRNPWNDIDFFVMIMMVLDFVLPLLIFPGHTTHDNAGSLFRVLHVFKGVRAVRVLRLLLTLRVLENLQELTSTFALSGPSIGAILLLMFTCLFMFSVVLHDLFQDSDPYRFGELFDTIFTLFQLFTLDDWSFVYLDSIKGGASYIIFFLMAYILIEYFTFLNLVIAVLVDNFQLALIKRQELQKQKSMLQPKESSIEDIVSGKPAQEGHMKPEDDEAFLAQLIKHMDGSEGREKQLLFTYLQLMASVEHLQQQFRSQAATTDKIVDSFFETAEQDIPHH